MSGEQWDELREQAGTDGRELRAAVCITVLREGAGKGHVASARVGVRHRQAAVRVYICITEKHTHFVSADVPIADEKSSFK